MCSVPSAPTTPTTPPDEKSPPAATTITITSPIIDTISVFPHCPWTSHPLSSLIAKAWHNQLCVSYGDNNSDIAWEIMNAIQHGIDIEYTGVRLKNRYGGNHSTCFDGDAEAKITAIIADDVASGKKAGPFDTSPFDFMSISPLGAVPKAGSSAVRVIHDLSYPRHCDSINEHIVDLSYHNSRFDDAANHVMKVGAGALLVKLDVLSAYKQIVVREVDWPLLGFKWNGKFYYDRTLPFGLRSSCRKWELFATALHRFMMDDLNIPHVEHYVDDFLLIIPKHDGLSRPLPEEHRDNALALCERLGMPMSPKKTEGPTTKLVFLGIELDTIAMEARLDDKRMASLKGLLSIWGEKTHATLKELQSLTGILSFAAQVVRTGRTYLRGIIDHAIAVSKSGRTSKYLAVKPLIPLSVRADIEWWTDFLADFNGRSLLLQVDWTMREKMDLYTDACTIGYGARFGRHWFQGKWTPEHLAAAQRIKRESMPYLEMLALTLAALTWGHHWTGMKIVFRCDCMPVVQALDPKKRTSATPSMMHLIRVLTASAGRHRYDFRVYHVSGITNVIADALSRFDPLDPSILSQLDPLPSPVHPLSLPPLPLRS